MLKCCVVGVCLALGLREGLDAYLYLEMLEPLFDTTSRFSTKPFILWCDNSRGAQAVKIQSIKCPNEIMLSCVHRTSQRGL